MSEPKETSVIIDVFDDPPKGPMPEWGIHPPTADKIIAALVRETDDHGMTRIQLGEVHAIAAELDRLRAENEALRKRLKAFPGSEGNDGRGKRPAPLTRKSR